MPTSNTTYNTDQQSIEWPTLAVFAFAYAVWIILTVLHNHLHWSVLVLVLSYTVALHSSLQHEVIHGHPTPYMWLNKVLAFPALGLAVPYERYEILHLQHHRNWLITDPFDDSESYFLARKQWLSCATPIKAVLNFNNTLIGRLIVGPAIMVFRMFIGEMKLAREQRDVAISWAWHLLGVALVIFYLASTGFPILFYVVGVAYPATSLLMLRSFGEHLPEENVDHRSAIIKTNALMQLLYLNNNYHRVHHDHPEVPWYYLPALYEQSYAEHNIHVYDGYLSLFKRFGFKQRYPVEHPFLAKD